MTMDRRTSLIALLAAGGLVGCEGALPFSSASKATPPANRRRKFLFIAIDDLRPMMGHYGDKGVITPHLDAFARHAISFDNAHTQVAVCGASRAALFTALRPDTTGMVTHQERIDRSASGRPYLHSSFREAGFTTAAMGKVLHFANDAADGWSEPHYAVPRVRQQDISAEMELNDSALDPASGRIWAEDPVRNPDGSRRRQPAWEAADVPDDAYRDGQMAQRAIDRLAAFAKSDDDFFLAVGFAKPHLPFNAPKKYWDLYDREKIALTPRPNPAQGAPPYAVTNSGEVLNYAGTPAKGDGGFDEPMTRLLTHGYMACVSYVDAQIGRVLEAVSKLGMWDDVVICLWGDHGYKLGDYRSWTKHTNYEIDTRVPLMLRVPGMTDTGARTDALVETVDIFPTLLELASIPVPSGLEGTSIAHLIANPGKPWKSAAFSRYDRRHQGRNLEGRSVRTRDFRYVVWSDAKTGKRVAEELYDRRTDPLETVSVAEQERYRADLLRLRSLQQKGWRAALPTASREKA